MREVILRQMAQLRLASEDRFALMDLSGPPDGLLPDDQQMAEVAATAIHLGEEWEFLWDLRDAGETIYNDTHDALMGVASLIPEGADEAEPWVPFTLLVAPGRAEEAKKALRPLPVKTIEMLPKPLPHEELELGLFDESIHRIETRELFYAQLNREILSAEEIAEAVVGPPHEWSPGLRRLMDERWLREAIQDDLTAAALEIARMNMLDEALSAATSRSVLTTMVLTFTEGHVHVIPFHGASLHHATTDSDVAVLLRPARPNGRYWATFRAEIEELETLINAPKVSEKEIERLLIGNPLFLSSLGYQEVYPQVVLPRGTGKSLIPDVIAEPADSEWAEVLDFKLPTASCSLLLLVGWRSRRSRSRAGMPRAGSVARCWRLSVIRGRAVGRIGWCGCQPSILAGRRWRSCRCEDMRTRCSRTSALRIGCDQDAGSCTRRATAAAATCRRACAATCDSPATDRSRFTPTGLQCGGPWPV